MSDISSSIPPSCDKCFEEFTTLWTINDVVNHFNKHLNDMKETIDILEDAAIENMGDDT